MATDLNGYVSETIDILSLDKMKNWAAIPCAIFAVLCIGSAPVQEQPGAALNGKVSQPARPAVQTAAPSSRKEETAPSFAKELNETASNYISLGWKLLLALVFPVAAWLVFKEWRRDALVIEPLDMPKELQELGFSGIVMSQLLSDHVFELQRSARLDDDPADIIFVELPKMQLDLQLPGMAWSLRGLIRYLKQAFGKPERRLIGEVVRKRTAYSIRLRLTSGRASDVPVEFHNGADLNGALKSAAEVAVTLIDPFEAASINYSRETVITGYPKTLKSIKLYLATTPATMHQDAYVLWASVCRALGDPKTLEEKLRQAEMANAKLWKGHKKGALGIRYRNFVGNLQREGLEFSQAESSFNEAIRCSPKNLAAMANLGLLYYDLWRLEDARRWFRRVTRSRPNSSRGYRGLGLVALRSGKFEEALLLLERSIDLAPFARWPRINRIDTYRWKGDYASALAAIGDFQSIDPEFPPFLRSWGDILVDMNDLNSAHAKYRESIRLNPFDAWTYVAYAKLLRRLGRLAEAKENIDKAFSLRPNFPGVAIFNAELLIYRGDSQAALKALEDVRALVAHDPYVSSRLVEELRRQGQFAMAKKVFAEMPMHVQTSSDALRARAWVHIDENELDMALACFQKAIAKAPNEPWGYTGVAEVHRRRRKYKDAIEAMENALKVRPLFLESHLRYGNLLFESGHPEDAIGRYRIAIQVAPYDANAYLMLANALRRQGKYDEALAVLDDALRLRPGMPDALRCQGDLLADSGDPDGAVKKYREAIDAAPDDLWGYLSLANALRYLERYEDAVEVAETLLEMQPSFLDAHLAYGNILRDSGDLDGAFKHYKDAAQVAPDIQWVRLMPADALRRQGKFADGLSIVEDALERWPNSVEAHLRHGDFLRDDGDLDGAAKNYQRALTITPSNPWIHLALAGICRRQRKHGKALAYINDALTLWPGMPAALQLYGDVLNDQGDLNGSVRKYREAIDNAPLDTEGYLALANLLTRHAKYREAVDVLHNALNLGRNRPAVLRRYGEVLASSGDTDGAAQKYRDAIQAAPQNVMGYLALADVLWRQTKHDDAIVTVQEALKLGRNTSLSLLCYGDILRSKGEYDQAEEKYRKAISKAPYDPRGYVALAKLLFIQKKTSEAIVAVEAILKRRPNLAEVWRLYGDILYVGEDLDGAIEQYRNAIQADPYDPLQYLALARLFERGQKYADAVVAVEAALNLQPDMPEALERLENLNQRIDRD